VRPEGDSASSATAGSGAVAAAVLAISHPVGTCGLGHRCAARYCPLQQVRVLREEPPQRKNRGCAVRVGLLESEQLDCSLRAFWLFEDQVIECRRNSYDSRFPRDELATFLVDALDEIADVGQELGLTQDVAAKSRQQSPVRAVGNVQWIVDSDVSDVVQAGGGGDPFKSVTS
jgi:hypothetical protein